MRCLYLLVLVLMVSCSNQSANKGIVPVAQISQKIKETNLSKSNLDSMLSRHNGHVLLYAKVSGQQNAVLVDEGEWPDDIEHRYNIMKDTSGTIVRIAAIDSDPKGNWDVECIHYFDPKGQTFAFEKRAGAFVLPKDGIAYETITDYFDDDFNQLKRNYQLVDKDNNALNRQRYGFTYTGIDTLAYKDNGECLNSYHIKP